MSQYSINTIVTDVGGVLVQDYEKGAVKRRTGLDDETFNRIMPGLLYRYGSGAIQEDAIWDVVEEQGGNHIETAENVFGTTYEASLQVNERVLRLMKDLSYSGFRLALFSNTIEPHAAVLRQAGVYDRTIFTEGIFLSHHMKMRKPELWAYEYVFSQLHTDNPGEVLFIDDLEENLKPARSIGMQTLRAVGSEEKIARSLEQRLGR